VAPPSAEDGAANRHRRRGGHQQRCRYPPRPHQPPSSLTDTAFADDCISNLSLSLSLVSLASLARASDCSDAVAEKRRLEQRFGVPPSPIFSNATRVSSLLTVHPPLSAGRTHRIAPSHYSASESVAARAAAWPARDAHLYLYHLWYVRTYKARASRYDTLPGGLLTSCTVRRSVLGTRMGHIRTCRRARYSPCALRLCASPRRLSVSCTHARPPVARVGRVGPRKRSLPPVAGGRRDRPTQHLSCGGRHPRPWHSAGRVPPAPVSCPRASRSISPAARQRAPKGGPRFLYDVWARLCIRGPLKRLRLLFTIFDSASSHHRHSDSRGSGSENIPCDMTQLIQAQRAISSFICGAPPGDTFPSSRAKDPQSIWSVFLSVNFMPLLDTWYQQFSPQWQAKQHTLGQP
jgi:hypothetical protein